jgi:hypothetical protein
MPRSTTRLLSRTSPEGSQMITQGDDVQRPARPDVRFVPDIRTSARVER